MTADQLHIESADGRRAIEYRIRNAHIEARVLEPDGEAGPATPGPWRRLTASEFSIHLAQNPALAHWLRARAQRPRPGEAEDESAA